MNRDQESNFATLHPAVTLVYFIAALILTMFSDSLYYLLPSLAAAFGYALWYKGMRVLKPALAVIAVITVMTTLLNGLFTHNGETVLFYFFSNRVTLEAFVYGAVLSLMLSATILWFVNMKVIMSSEKVIFLFGKVLPVLGLVLSMILRFIPLLRNRFLEVDSAQKAMGRDQLKGPVSRLRQTGKEMSILVSWSLESSIESADSMTARGYGLRGRTAFSLFHWEGRDTAALLLWLLFGTGAVAGLMLKVGKYYYYPVIRRADSVLGPSASAVLYTVYLIFLLMPAVWEIWGELQWKRSRSGI